MKTQRASVSRSAGIATALALLSLPAAGQALDFVAKPNFVKGVRLNDDLAPGSDSGDIEDYVVDDTGSWLVYRAQGEATDRCDLYTVPTDRSSPAARLSGPGLVGEGVQGDYTLSPDGTTVVYRADAEVAGRFELYSVPIDASSSAEKLNDLSAGAGIGGFAIASDGATVAFFGESSAGTHELFRVPIDGITPPQQLGPSLTGGKVFQELWLPVGGTHVLYLADQDVTGLHELYTVPYDGTGSAQKLNDPLLVGGCIYRAEVAPDGSRVVFTADPNQVFRIELYSAPVDGSAAATSLSGAMLDPSEDVEGFLVSPDSASVALAADLDVVGVVELYGVPIDGSSGASKISGTMVAGGDVLDTGGVFGVPTGFAFDPTGTRVVYLADQDTDETAEIYSAPIDGSSAAVKLNDALPAGTEVDDMETHPASPLVVYCTQGSGHIDVYSVPIAGGTAPTEIYEVDPTSFNQFSFAISSGAARVSFVSPIIASGEKEFFSAPITGGAPPVKHSGTMAPNGGVDSAWIHDAAGLALYVADQQWYDVLELFAGPVSGATPGTRLSGDLFGGTIHGDVYTTIPVGGARSAVYVAAQEHPNIQELYASSLERNPEKMKLSSTSTIALVTPDGETFIYSKEGDLYRAPTADLGSPTLLSDAVGTVFNAQISDDSSTLFFSDLTQTYSLPIAGGSPPMLVYSDSVTYDLTPDGSLLVFDGFVDSIEGIYTVSTDGLETVTRLTPTLQGTERIRSHVMTSDGATVIYEVGDIGTNEDLWSVPVDASSAAVRISERGFEVNAWWVSPDGASVVYRANHDTPSQHELFAVPSDGSSAPMAISGTMIAGGNVVPVPVVFSADSTTVVYRADAFEDNTFELFSAPVSGASAPVLLSGTLVPDGDVLAEILVSDDGWVVYRAIALTLNVRELFSVPIDGSAPPVRLNQPLLGTFDVQDDFEISPDGRTVVYRADADITGKQELFAVPIDRASGPRRVNAPLRDGGTIIGFAFTPDGSKMLYFADAIDESVFELFYSDLELGPWTRKAPPGGPKGMK